MGVRDAVRSGDLRPTSGVSQVLTGELSQRLALDHHVGRGLLERVCRLLGRSDDEDQRQRGPCRADHELPPRLQVPWNGLSDHRREAANSPMQERLYDAPHL